MNRRQRRKAAKAGRGVHPLWRGARADARLQRALSCHQSGRLAEAERIYTEILSRQPNHALALYFLGLARLQEGDAPAAAELQSKVIAARPDFAEAHDALGNALSQQGRLEGAVASYLKAVQLNPRFAEAHNNLGIALTHQGKLAEAAGAFQTAIKWKPDFAEAHNNLGNALTHEGKVGEAVAAYRKALKLRPGDAQTYNNLGSALIDQGKMEEALLAYRRAVALDPSNAPAQAMLVHTLQQLCDWHDLEAAAGKLDELVDAALERGVPLGESPLLSVTRCTEPARNLAIAKAASADIAMRMSALEGQLPAQIDRAAGGKIRIGYLSGDFHDHATAHLMVSLFGLHDRDGFEISAYSYGPDDASDYRKRIAEDCDSFVDVRALSAAAAARRIRKDGIDILVDLKGHTKGGRLEICALRPAPIQATYLGFPGSSGAEFFDYVLTDRIVTPEDQAAYYTEKFVYLPHCYQVNDHTLEISDRPLRRADFALPEEGFVFCSFNQSYKLEPVMWEVWMAILRSVPGAVLWLYCRNETARRNLGREAANRDVDPGRIVFADKLPKREHLARLGLADLFLDTRVYNSHTTASDALWAGVPPITLQGSHFASRVASSLLTAIGLPELITHGLDDYHALAVRLARDREELAALRMKLSRNRLTEPLFDTPRFARGLEQAYLMMWQLHAAGEPPRRLEVPGP